MARYGDIFRKNGELVEFSPVGYMPVGKNRDISGKTIIDLDTPEPVASKPAPVDFSKFTAGGSTLPALPEAVIPPVKSLPPVKQAPIKVTPPVKQAPLPVPPVDTPIPLPPI